MKQPGKTVIGMADCFSGMLGCANTSPKRQRVNGARRFLLFTRLRFGLVLSFLLSITSPLLADQPDQQILVHYMPWYTADAEQNQFGWHWTMNHFDPTKVNDGGKREIASHHYPQIGPYDSGDPHVLEYHVLLMKLSGIDGVVVDWYGSRDFRDYAMIDRNTRALIPWLKKAGLKFTFCYEDQTVKHLIADKKIEATEDVRETVAEFNKLATDYLKDDSWVRLDGKPVLLIFGPQHFEPKSWKKVTEKLKTPPLIFGLPHLADKFELDGVFAWPPVHGGKEVEVKQWKSKLESTYKTKHKLIASAFPGFHDIYSEAKLHDSYGFIDDRDGKTFRETLSMAKATSAPLIQIATWNDFGEGTIIEPTEEFGFEHLKHLVETDSDAKFDKEDLELPLMLFKLRQSSEESANAISDALFEGDCARARKLLNRK